MLGKIATVGLWLYVAIIAGVANAEASFFSLPRMLKAQYERMSFHAPALAPMAHTQFCLDYPADCRRSVVDFRRREIEMTIDTWNELNAVNWRVNRGIEPRAPRGNLLDDRWVIWPKTGDCHDYAVTKRHELLKRGWPSRSLLLAEVVIGDGEHHLVLVVRTKDNDLVLDNLNYGIRPAALVSYKWLRIESTGDPRFWMNLANTDANV
jgi:predicted transglutaminase-like cysteine proteinase